MSTTSIKPNAFLGKVLDFRKMEFDCIMLGWRDKLCPIIGRLIQRYDKLGLDPFTEETLQDLILNRISNLKNRYIAALRKDFRSFRTPIALDLAVENADKQLKLIADDIQALHNERAELNITLGRFSNNAVSWADCSIQDGALKIQEQQIRQRCQLVIETEQEATLYGHMLAVKREYDGLLSFLNQHNYDTSLYPVIGHAGLFREDDDGSLSLHLEMVKAALQ